MALTIGQQTGAAEDTLTLVLLEQTAEPDWVGDYFYAATSYLDVEPPVCTASAILHTSGNASVVLSGLEPGRLYWVHAWRHFTDGHTEAAGVGTLLTRIDCLWPHYTLGWSLPKLPVTSPWVETWERGFSEWADEYPMARGQVRVKPDDGIMGSRYAQFDAAGPDPLASRQAWHPGRPFSVRNKVRITEQSGFYPQYDETIWRPFVVVMESEGGYIQGSAEMSGTFWKYGWPGATHNRYIRATSFGEVHEYRIDFDGASTWQYYIDGSLSSTIYGYTPKGPLRLWWNTVGVLDVGEMTVTGTPFFYFAGDNAANKYWTGSFSVREGNDVDGGTWDADYGGITAPNTTGSKISACRGANGTTSQSMGYPFSVYVAGAFNARSPIVRAATYRELLYNGSQANGSLTLNVCRASDDVVLFGPLSPADATTQTLDVSSIPPDTEIYFDVQGNVAAEGEVAPILHFIALDADPPVLPQVLDIGLIALSETEPEHIDFTLLGLTEGAVDFTLIGLTDTHRRQRRGIFPLPIGV